MWGEQCVRHECVGHDRRLASSWAQPAPEAAPAHPSARSHNSRSQPTGSPPSPGPHRVSDLAPSSSRPHTSRLPVRVKALFMAPVPAYCRLTCRRRSGGRPGRGDHGGSRWGAAASGRAEAVWGLHLRPHMRPAAAASAAGPQRQRRAPRRRGRPTSRGTTRPTGVEEAGGREVKGGAEVGARQVGAQAGRAGPAWRLAPPTSAPRGAPAGTPAAGSGPRA